MRNILKYHKKELKKSLLLGLIMITILSIAPLVLSENWYKGTLHQHTGFSTNYGYDKNISTTGDQCPKSGVFILGKEIPNEGHDIGNTTSEIVEKAKNFSHSFIAITDHTYCLREQNFNVIKQNCTDEGNFICLPGEELSTTDVINDGEESGACRYSRAAETGEAHIGAIGIEDYISQTPFGMHCPRGPHPQDAIDNIISQGGIAILNHPSTLLFNSLDFKSINDVSGETGIEIWNDGLLFGWFGLTLNSQSLQRWIHDRLLRGIKSYAFSGTDSHADAHSVPYQYIYLTSLNENNLKEGLKSGRHVASNNGWLDLSIGNVSMGSTANATEGENITIKVDYDVDNSCILSLHKGVISEYEVQIGDNISISDPPSFETFTDTPTRNSYYRAQCIGGFFDQYRIYTNPIWVQVTRIITIANNGTVNLNVTSININYTGYRSNWIILNPSALNDTIPVGGARNITVNIVKSNTGSNKLNTAYITITNSDGGSETVDENDGGLIL